MIGTEDHGITIAVHGCGIENVIFGNNKLHIGDIHPAMLSLSEISCESPSSMESEVGVHMFINIVLTCIKCCTSSTVLYSTILYYT
jgi:hypothetical protein